jgi:hypothetical protein
VNSGRPLQILGRNYEAVQSDYYATNTNKIIHNQPQQYQLHKLAQDSSQLRQQIQLDENVHQSINEQSQNKEINGPHVVYDQQVLPPSEHVNNNEFNREQSIFDHSDYVALPTQDVSEAERVVTAQNQFSSPVVVQQQQDEIVQPSESANAAHSYQNLVFNPFGKELNVKCFKL